MTNHGKHDDMKHLARSYWRGTRTQRVYARVILSAQAAADNSRPQLFRRSHLPCSRSSSVPLRPW